MHFIYKLIALSVVFGLVLCNPAAKMTEESFDDLAYYPYDQSWYNVADLVPEDIVAEESHPVGIVVPKIELPSSVSKVISFVPKIAGVGITVVGLLVGIIKKIVGLKAKIIGLVLKIAKWLAPKGIFVAIGAIATVAFYKLTSLFTSAYAVAPVSVYDYVPSEVRNYATPEQLENAQQYLVRAMQQFAKQ